VVFVPDPREVTEDSWNFVVHLLYCAFHRQVHILGEIGTNVPHGIGTAEPPGAVGPAPWHNPSPRHPLSSEHKLDE
jgi:hypothetical protein